MIYNLYETTSILLEKNNWYLQAGRTYNYLPSFKRPLLSVPKDGIRKKTQFQMLFKLL